MIPRYSRPEMTAIWSPETRFRIWFEIEAHATSALAEIGVEADEVGVANAGSKVLSSTPKPPKTAGEKVTDEGDGGTKIAEYLVGQKII